MLEKIGFRYLNQVDPFDGGPHYSALLRAISVVRSTRFFRFQWEIHRSIKQNKRALILALKHGAARAVVSDYETKQNTIQLPAATARALPLKEGERISVTPIER